MSITIDSAKIGAFLDSKNIKLETRTVYQSVLESLEQFAKERENLSQPVILSQFLGQDLKPKARMLYNSVVNMYLNYIDSMSVSSTYVEPKHEEPKSTPMIKAQPRVKVPFVAQEINFENLCYFDDSAFFVENCEEYHAIGDEMEKAELAFMSGKHFCLRGKAGTGKTSLAIFLAKKHNMPVVKIACNEGVKDYHLIGSKSIDSKTDLPKHEAGLLMQAVLLANKYGKCEIILDEVNTLKPQTMKVINPFMDETRFINVNGYGKLKLNEGAQLFVFGTMNLNYAGTNDLNPEFKGRFTMDEIKNVPRAMQEKILSRYNVRKGLIDCMIDLVEKINYQQQISEIDPLTVFSTREQLSALAMIEAGIENGMSEQKALSLALSVNFTEKLYEVEQQTKIQRVICDVFGALP